MQDETKFKLKVAEFLHDLPRTWAKKIQQVAISGVPDYLCCINGHFVAIELKRNDTELLSGLQVWNINKISNSGGTALKVCPENWKETKKLLIKLTEDKYGKIDKR